MEAKDVKKAVSILYDMEIHNYKMTRAIQRLNYEISCLGNPKRFDQPSEPEYPSLHQEPTGCLFPIIGMIVGFVVGMVIGLQSEMKFLLTMFLGFLGPFIGGGLAYGIEYLFHAAKCGEDEEELYRDRLRSYERKMRDYFRAIELDEIRVEKELQQKKILEVQRSELIKRRQKAEQILAAFYMKVGVDQSYRSLIPISKMHEIISLGITTEFYGENGLNDRVRRELREDAFYVKLDEISQKLDTIVSKTDRLYGEILNLNSQCETLISATMKSAQIAANNNALLSEAVKNTEIAAYNSERIAAEERYQSFIMTYRY